MSEPLTGELVTQLQQEDLRLMLGADDLFNNISVFTEDDHDVESQMNRALGIFDTKDGARGVAVMIQQPSASDRKTGIQRGPLLYQWTFLVAELRVINKDTTTGGTGKKALTVACRIHRILKSHSAGGLVMNFTPSDPCIVPVAFSIRKGDSSQPLVAYEVRFTGEQSDFTIYTTVENAAISGATIVRTSGALTGTAGDTITLSCATAGAAIYYTTNGTHPCSQNSAATLYTVPFLSVAGLLRARAFKAGSIGSNTNAAQIT